MAAGRERSLSTLFNTHDSPRPPQPVPRTPGPQVIYMRTIVSQTPPVHALYTIIITITNTTPREPWQPSRTVRTAVCGGPAERRVTPAGPRARRREAQAPGTSQRTEWVARVDASASIGGRSTRLSERALELLVRLTHRTLGEQHRLWPKLRPAHL